MDQNFPFADGAYGPFAAPIVPRQFHAGIQGNEFYVNATEGGTDDVDIPWPKVDNKICFDSMQGAVDATVSNRGDTIWMKRSEEISSPVLFNKTGIRVIAQNFGMAPGARGEYQALYAASTLTGDPVAVISAGCYIEGIGFASEDAGTSFWEGAALLIGGAGTAAPFGVHLKHCRFPHWGMDNRYGLSIEGSSDCLIEGCDFQGGATDFVSGIYVQGACANLEVRDCRFRDCDYAITQGSFSDAGVNTALIYKGNVVCTPDSKFLNGAGNTVRGIMCDNWVYTDSASTTTNSVQISTMETAGMQSVGNHYSTEKGENATGL